MKQLVRHLWLILVVTGVVLFTNLGGPRLWDRDEPRNAGCAAEMLQRGDWVVPVFNAQLRSAKPVLLYWLMMAAYGVFGVNEFAARLPSAVLGVGTVLMTYAIGRRLFNARAALWGAVILATSLMFDVAARAATPDSALIFFSTAAILVYVLGTFQRKDDADESGAVCRPIRPGCYFPTSWPVVAAMYGLMGAAVLAKGPVGLVLPTAVIGMFLLIMYLPGDDEKAADPPASRPWHARLFRTAAQMLRPFWPPHFVRTCWRMRPLTAMAAVAVVALPWYVWVGVRDFRWIEGFFLEQNVGRAMHSMEGHSGSLLYYPAAVLAGFFPWSLLAGPVLIGWVARVRRRDRWHVGYVFLACWVCVWVGVFSLAKTKLPSYVTPMYPALALATGSFIYYWTRDAAIAGRGWLRLAMAILAAVGVAMLVGVPIAARRYLPGDEWLGALGLVPLAGAIVCLVLIERRHARAAATVFAATAVALATTMFGFVSLRVDRHQHLDVLLAEIRARSDAPKIASFGPHEPSWVFYARRPIRRFGERREEAARYLAGGGADTFVITTEGRYRQLRPDLPPDAKVLARARYFLHKANLVVVGRGAPSSEMAERPITPRR